GDTPPGDDDRSISLTLTLEVRPAALLRSRLRPGERVLLLNAIDERLLVDLCHGPVGDGLVVLALCGPHEADVVVAAHTNDHVRSRTVAAPTSHVGVLLDLVPEAPKRLNELLAVPDPDLDSREM